METLHYSGRIHLIFILLDFNVLVMKPRLGLCLLNGTLQLHWTLEYIGIPSNAPVIGVYSSEVYVFST